MDPNPETQDLGPKRILKLCKRSMTFRAPASAPRSGAGLGMVFQSIGNREEEKIGNREEF